MEVLVVGQGLDQCDREHEECVRIPIPCWFRGRGVVYQESVGEGGREGREGRGV